MIKQDFDIILLYNTCLYTSKAQNATKAGSAGTNGL